MSIDGATVLVTGSSRGLGRALVPAFLEAGAGRVYATARNTGSLAFADKRVQVVGLDVTQEGSVLEAAGLCGDSDIVVNNAAYISNTPLIRIADLDAARLEMETNYWGVLRMCRAFAPHLAKRDKGMIVNILSIASLAGVPFCGSYAASKAATWSLTQSIRAELAAQGTRVAAVFAGAIATEMARPQDPVDVRCPPEIMATSIVAALERGELMVFPDDSAREVAALYGARPWDLETLFASKLD